MPSDWLEPLGLKREFGIGQVKYVRCDLPAWAGLLVWAGWWMRRAQVPGARIFLTLLMPTRNYCAPLGALGALFGSIGRTGLSIAWSNFLELPPDTRVYLRIPDHPNAYRALTVEGGLGPAVKIGGSHLRKIRIISDTRRLQGLTLEISAKSFFKYDISLNPHTPARHARRLQGVGKFYADVSPNFEPAWLTFWSPESVVVTNQADWSRQLTGLNAVVKSAEGAHVDVSVQDLLMPASVGTSERLRTVLTSPRTAMRSLRGVPVAILDGAEALRSWELISISASNLVVLLDRSEYDPQAQDTLTQLASYRNDQLMPIPEGIPNSLPGGIEMTMFAIPVGESR